MTYIKTILFTSLISLTYLLTGCGEEYLQTELPRDVRKNLDPAVLEGARFYKDIPYGKADEDIPDEAAARQKFDVIIPECETACPVVIYIHGGAFWSGDKRKAYVFPKDDNGETLEDAENGRYVYATQELLERGIAVATINYRFINRDTPEDLGLLAKPLEDVTRAVQTVKSWGLGLGYSSTKVMLSGSSAGAGAALWLAYSDDKQNPDAADPIEKVSTRVLGVYAYKTQATYDILKWDQDVMPNINAVNELLGGNNQLASARKLITKAYKMDSFTSRNDLFASDVTEKRRGLDILSLMTSDDPEVWVDNTSVQGTYQSLKTEDAFYHGPEHAIALHNRAQQLGLTHTAVIKNSSGQDQYLSGPQDANAFDFAERILGM